MTTVQPQFKSDAFKAIHSAAAGLYRSAVVNKQTMREFDVLCLVQAPCFDAIQNGAHESINQSTAT